MLTKTEGHLDFDPEKDIPSLQGKVIFISGGTAGLGAASAEALAAHNPQHIYISGRNRITGDDLIAAIQAKHPKADMTFVPMDLASMASVKEGVQKYFKHSRLDILLNNAGIMAASAVLSKDGYEIQFATNHLGHAMLTDCLLPTLLRTAEQPGSDVRIVSLTSLGYAFHPGNGISFDELNNGGTMKRFLMGSWIRYGHSKLANILFTTELARRHPSITSVVIHPGVVDTPLNQSQPWYNRYFVSFTTWLQGIPIMEPHEGALNSLWCAAGAKKEELANGAFYFPIGSERTATLDKTARDGALAKKLWEWTEGVLAKV